MSAPEAPDLSALSAADQQLARRIAPALLQWWEHHGRRDLPWQQEPTPWRVWVSEIMLQQTRVATVLEYYPRFIARFPDPVTLADAPLDEVLYLWSGLGYYARARNLHRAAGEVRDVHAGAVPQEAEALEALPGIGRSTAGAILALAANRRYPILDGNVKRVLSRVFAVEGWPGRSAVARRLWALADHCTPADHPARYTQGIMDLGAGPCARRNPACTACPLAADCRARLAGTPEAFPEPRPARERPQRSCVMLIVISARDGSVLLERRPPTGIWGGLWCFPELEAIDSVPHWCRTWLGCEPDSVRPWQVLRHGFTHFDLQIQPVEIRMPQQPSVAMEADHRLWYKTAEPATIGLAAPMARLLARLGEME